MSPAEPAAASGESATDSGTAQWYRHFGTLDAPGSSPCYAEWSVGIAGDPELIRRIDLWPHHKRQPLLILAAARFLGAQISPYRDFRNFLDTHWAEVSDIVLSRATQTNEAGRCATLLPSLAQISATEGRPLALIEVGASAGLALFPDRYGYEYVPGADTGTEAGTEAVAPGAVPAPGTPAPRRPRTQGRRGWFRPAHGPAPTPSCAASPQGRCRCRRHFPRWSGAPGSTSIPWMSVTRTTSPGWKLSSGRSRSSASNGCARRSQSPGNARRCWCPATSTNSSWDWPPGLRKTRPWWCSTAPSWPTSTPAAAPGSAAPWRILRRSGAATGSRTRATRCSPRPTGPAVVPEMDDARLRGRFLLLQDGQPTAIAGPHGQSLEWL